MMYCRDKSTQKEWKHAHNLHKWEIRIRYLDSDVDAMVRFIQNLVVQRSEFDVEGDSGDSGGQSTGFQ